MRVEKIIFIYCLLLAGCVPQDIKPQSKMLQAETLGFKRTTNDFKVSAANWPSSRWWEAFGDQQLNDLVLESLATSPDLRGADVRIRQAAAVAGGRAALLWPSANASASFSRSRTSLYGEGNGQWRRLYDTKISTYFDLDVWGKNRAALDAALGRVKAQEVDLYATRLYLSHSVVQAYINLSQIYSELAIQKKLLATNMQLLDLTQQRYSADLDSMVTVKQAFATIPATRAEIASLQEMLELTRNQLAMLVGKGPDRGWEIKEPKLKDIDVTIIPSRLPAELLGRRPDILAQRWLVEAAGYEIKSSRAGYYPNINLSSFIGLQAFNFNNLHKRNSYQFSVGPALSLPIFDGGSLDADLEEATSEYDLAVENYNSSLTSAIQDLGDQLTSLKWLQKRLRRQIEAVHTAEESADLAYARYASGLESYLQVAATQNAVLKQRLLLTQLYARGLSLHAELSRALGGGYMPNSSVAFRT